MLRVVLRRSSIVWMPDAAPEAATLGQITPINRNNPNCEQIWAGRARGQKSVMTLGEPFGDPTC